MNDLMFLSLCFFSHISSFSGHLHRAILLYTIQPSLQRCNFLTGEA